jgi:hypothetical protein
MRVSLRKLTNLVETLARHSTRLKQLRLQLFEGNTDDENELIDEDETDDVQTEVSVTGGVAGMTVPLSYDKKNNSKK